jgi:pyruvate/2-oxoglutarate dehydrogenase complex dihydrolipoamide dehydrogenase (E3) component
MTKDKNHFDSIIIGSGQAGNPLAQALAKAGKNVAMIEKGHLGGTCVNTGCTPTKAYVASARAAWVVKNSERLGVSTSGEMIVDLKAVKARKDKLILTPRNGIEQALEGTDNISLIRGSAKFNAAKTVEVNGQEYTADQIFINVGARPRSAQGFETVTYHTNESILELEEIPEHLIIIGGSYIGLEFAQIFRRFGSKVTVVEMNAHLINKEDESTSERIAEILENEGINLELNANCIGGKPYGDGVEVQVDCGDDSKRIRGSHVLMAVGRQSNADLLNLNVAGIEHDKHFYINVNETCETNAEGVFALGDCNGNGAFTHTAYNDFEIVNDHLFGAGSRKLSDRHLNYALYIDPPMGRVGMSRDQALDAGHDILFAKIEMADVSRAKERAETDGFMEVVVDATTERILGATVLGIGGDEIIGVFITAMYAKVSYKVLRDSVQTHPTVTELIPSMLKGLKRIEEKK